VARAKANVSVSSQMKHEVRIAHGMCQAIQVKRIALHEAEAGRLLCLCQELGLPGGEIIVANHLVAVSQQAIHQIAPDKAAGSRDKVTQMLISKPDRLFEKPLFLSQHQQDSEINLSVDDKHGTSLHLIINPSDIFSHQP